jgi:hypothetical protein
VARTITTNVTFALHQRHRSAHVAEKVLQPYLLILSLLFAMSFLVGAIVAPSAKMEAAKIYQAIADGIIFRDHPRACHRRQRVCARSGLPPGSGHDGLCGGVGLHTPPRTPGDPCAPYFGCVRTLDWGQRSSKSAQDGERTDWKPVEVRPSAFPGYRLSALIVAAGIETTLILMQ